MREKNRRMSESARPPVTMIIFLPTPGLLLVKAVETVSVVGNSTGDAFSKARLVKMEDLVFGSADKSLGDEGISR